MQQHLTTIQSTIAQDLDQLETILEETLETDSKLASSITKHITMNAGKRIRPVALILMALALGYSRDEGMHVEMACVIELLHTATLLHDDVIDSGTMRRGKQSSNAVWGNQACVLSGDYLFAKAFEMMTDLESIAIMQILSRTTNDIVLGELKHLEIHHMLSDSSFNYLNIIGLKTAKLFAASTKIGALLAKTAPAMASIASEFGHHLGVLFQIQDDIMDYSTSCENSGKDAYQDFYNRKPTLPLIMAYQQLDSSQRQEMSNIFADKTSNIKDILPFLESTNALALCNNEARITHGLALQCLEKIPQNSYNKALSNLVNFAINRQH